jgi:hypothetical protein
MLRAKQIILNVSQSLSLTLCHSDGTALKAANPIRRTLLHIKKP